MRRAPSSIATAPTSTRSSARSVPATSASTRCTSTSTRPSRPRTAAAARARARSCCRKRSRRSDRCRSSRKMPDGSFKLVEEENAGEEHPDAFGRMVAFHGQMGMFTRALAYILSHGADGLKQVAEDAVLNANYMPAQPRGRARRAVRQERAVHARGDLLRQRLRRRRQHDRSRQGADRRGLPPDDHVFPAGRPRGDAGRADRDRIQGEPRPVHHGACARSPSGRKAGDQSLKAAPIYAPRRRLDENAGGAKAGAHLQDAAPAEAAE